MDNTRWMQLRAAFEAAVDVPAERRASFVDALALDGEVRAELLGMLEADARNERMRANPDAGARLHRLLRALADATHPALATMD